MNLPVTDLIISEYKAVIFDLDGTLLDSMRVWYEVDEAFLSKRGFPLTEEYTDFVKRANMRDSAVYTIEQFNLDMTPEEVMDEWNDMVYEAYRDRIKLKDGAMEYIRKLKDSGLKIGVATALTSPNALACLKSNQVIDLFDTIVTLEDLGDNIDKRTPHVYLHTASKLGVNPDETLVFEDVAIAAGGAKKGNFDTCAVYDEIGCGGEFESFAGSCDYAFVSWKDLGA